MNKILLILITLFCIFSLSLAARAPEVEWSKTFGGPEEDGGNSVIQTQDGGYAIAGYYDDKGLILKLDSLGDSLWTFQFKKPNKYQKLKKLEITRRPSQSNTEIDHQKYLKNKKLGRIKERFTFK